MHHSALIRAVARATGESRGTIECRGFHLQEDRPAPDDEICLALECPGCGTVIGLSRDRVSRRPSLAECANCDAVYPYQADEVYAAPLSELGTAS